MNRLGIKSGFGGLDLLPLLQFCNLLVLLTFYTIWLVLCLTMKQQTIVFQVRCVPSFVYPCLRHSLYFFLSNDKDFQFKEIHKKLRIINWYNISIVKMWCLLPKQNHTLYCSLFRIQLFLTEWEYTLTMCSQAVTFSLFSRFLPNQ